MFSFIEDTVNSSLNIVSDILDGEAPRKKDVAKVIATGVEVAVGAALLDGAVSILDKFTD